MPINYESLNEAQLDAVETCSGPLLVLAGAGSGKTRVLTYRIAHMIEDLGIEPWNILAITFTNKAAQEMRDRLSRLLEGRSTRGMWVCTFHAMCVRMLRLDGERLGYTSNFAIYDDDDSKRLVKQILSDLRINEKSFPVAGIRSLISGAKNELISADEYARLAKLPLERTAARVYKELDSRLRRANAMDFDDLLVNALVLLENNPDLLDQYQDRFTHISVDEYQDTNHVQYKICNLLAQKYQNIMVVGDDDQSIYSWRGADIRNILDFAKDYPQAHVVKLEENYRSYGHILEAANAVVAHNKERTKKRLFTNAGDGDKVKACQKRDEIAEANYIAGEIKSLYNMGVDYSDIAVFYRTNAQSRVLEDGLVKAGIPYKIIGATRFFDRAEIRDVTAYLKLVVNPADDVSARRVINKPLRGIGETTQQKIADIAETQRISFVEACGVLLAEDPSISKKARNGIVQFLQIISNGSSYSGDLSKIVDMIIDETGLMSALYATGTEEAKDRIENIKEFIGVVKEYERNHTLTDELLSNSQIYETDEELEEEIKASAGDLSLAGFMEWLALRTDLDTADSGESSVTLMTVHSAKGLEYDNVFVAGLEETVFPHIQMFGGSDNGKIEEERRLAYVAITRARKRLYLCYAELRHLYGQTMHNPKSRFISEIPLEHITFVGTGSEGFDGFGYDRRGSRHGIAGAGHSIEVYDGQVFGNRTRSAGGNTSSSKGTSMSFSALGLEGTKEALSQSKTTSAFTPPKAPVAHTISYNSLKSESDFKKGDLINHKKFGLGSIMAVDGDKLTVAFESGVTKNLLKGYAPIVKVN
ncbi:MAG: UvrD-helicase domain-containing protein [Coriobacteriales bacterium]|nr:UvrD-helicase domain-containing protein [Coriobacteriales bacterium]